MTIKKFGNKKIIIRKLTREDLKIADKFRDFTNSLVAENAKIAMNEKIDLKGEHKFLSDTLNSVKNKKRVYLIAECDEKIIGTASITQLSWRSNHVGELGGIAVKDGYRRLGLGKYMMAQIIELAKKELHPKPKMIRLFVYINNKPAIRLYRKLGFKKVAKLPKHIQYKGKLIDEFAMILEL